MRFGLSYRVALVLLALLWLKSCCQVRLPQGMITHIVLRAFFAHSVLHHSPRRDSHNPCITVIRSNSTSPSFPPPNHDPKARIRRFRENSVMQAAPVRNAHSHEGLPAGGEAGTCLARPCRSFVIFNLSPLQSFFSDILIAYFLCAAFQRVSHRLREQKHQVYACARSHFATAAMNNTIYATGNRRQRLLYSR